MLDAKILWSGYTHGTNITKHESTSKKQYVHNCQHSVFWQTNGIEQLITFPLVSSGTNPVMHTHFPSMLVQSESRTALLTTIDRTFYFSVSIIALCITWRETTDRSTTCRRIILSPRETLNPDAGWKYAQLTLPNASCASSPHKCCGTRSVSTISCSARPSALAMLMMSAL